jgi:glycosidase/fibronectin type 3 domain-containing protein
MRGTGRLAAFVAVAFTLLVLIGGGAQATSTPVVVVGDFQHLVGCSGDWDPACASSAMTEQNGAYEYTANLPAGSYQYKVALGGSWSENYGAHAAAGGGNISLTLPSATTVTFYFDPATHWITDDVNSQIVTAPGDYQTQVGCGGDWDPSCFKSWLEDIDGDGTYTFATTSLTAGSYQMKVALNGSWTVNYGVGGAQNGPNVAFTVPYDHAPVTFSYNGATHVPSVLSGHAHDNNVEWDGLGYDSRSTLYRTPQGAVPAGTPVLLRFRTFHDDVTAVTARVWDVNANAQSFLSMTRVSAGAPCFQTSLASERCDYWQASLPTSAAGDVYWYRFIVRDGTSVAYYGDDTTALDGGVGRTTSNEVDTSFAITAYGPGFTVPAWAKHAVVYQIFPDRFANGDTKNDPKPTDALYDTHPTLKPWDAKPEGYCRSYDTACGEGPHGTDYFGGDLKGIRQKLEYIHDNGFNTIYLNPIFWAKSNHRYDTADYLQVDPYLGDMKEFKLLVQQAHGLGMHIILDGVFNHMSSDSPFFDRYHHYATTGACEALDSQYRSWFQFTDSNVPCGAGDYTGWAGFDSIPVLNKSNPGVIDYFLSGSDSVAKHWLRAGADGWRLDVMGDPSFPPAYWKTFRDVVKQTDPSALIVGELWQKDSTLLRLLDGSGADSTMNYRLRDAALGLLVPPGQGFDGKGFGDSGHALTPSQFAARMESQQEDYAPQVYSALMNLVDSHDTARALWDLTPGTPDTAAKEQNATNLAQGKQRLDLASLLQYTLPGMPTVYYGDEVGVTGGDDPDNRRTYPWPSTGGKPDAALLAHYQGLAQLRSSQPELVDGDFKVLLADDTSGTVAYGRKDGSHAAVVALNPTTASQTVTIPVAGWLPDGTSLTAAYGSGGGTVSGGSVSVTLPALGGAVLVTDAIDLTPPAAPSGLAVDSVSAGAVALHWSAVSGASSYAVYRSPVTRGGYVKVAGGIGGTSFTDTTAPNGIRAYYVVRALDDAGNESGDSNEVSALPSLQIGWAILQWPKTIDAPLQASGWTVYGQVYVAGLTDRGGDPGAISAQLGWGTSQSVSSWHWVAAAYNAGHTGDNNYEYMATFLPTQTGTYYYGYRFSTDGGDSWTYGDQDGVGTSHPGVATITAPADTTPPAAPTGLHVVTAGPTEIDLAWDANSEPDLAGYEIDRSDGGPFTQVGSTGTPSFADTNVVTGTTYTYVVKAIDTSANVSSPSASVTATAQVRTVHVTFTATVPATTPPGSTVYVAGTFAQLGYADWDPAGIALHRNADGTWSVTLDAPEGAYIEYKYTLGSWDYVEKGAACDELSNRKLTVSYGTDGTQTVDDTVANWRNVSPCGP